MSDGRLLHPSWRLPARQHVRLGSVLALVVGLLLWFALHEAGGSSTLSSSTVAVPAEAASVGQIRAVSASLGRPIYWVGFRRGYTYELTRLASGNIILRYLPHGVDVGTKDPYLTVGTYPFPGALAAIKALAKQPEQVLIGLAGGGIAILNSHYPESIHLAFPDSDYQVEVFDPSPTAVHRLVTSGQVSAIG